VPKGQQGQLILEKQNQALGTDQVRVEPSKKKPGGKRATGGKNGTKSLKNRVFPLSKVLKKKVSGAISSVYGSQLEGKNGAEKNWAQRVRAPADLRHQGCRRVGGGVVRQPVRKNAESQSTTAGYQGGKNVLLRRYSSTSSKKKNKMRANYCCGKRKKNSNGCPEGCTGRWIY